VQHIVNLTANVWTKQESLGQLLVLLDQGAANTIAVRIYQGPHILEEISSAATGFKARMLQGSFTHFELKADANCQAKIVVTENAIDFDWFEGSRVHIISSLADPVYVTQVGVPAGAIGDAAAVAVTDALTAVIGADATRAEIRFYNQGPDPAALGGAGLTWAKRTIVLDPGETWIEDRAANLAWSAITDAGNSASVTTQAITT
jgi:hypothetical protein